MNEWKTMTLGAPKPEKQRFKIDSVIGETKLAFRIRINGSVIFLEKKQCQVGKDANGSLVADVNYWGDEGRKMSRALKQMNRLKRKINKDKRKGKKTATLQKQATYVSLAKWKTHIFAEARPDKYRFRINGVKGSRYLAYQVDFCDLGVHWIPKSVCQLGVHASGAYYLVELEGWFAKAKGFIGRS